MIKSNGGSGTVSNVGLKNFIGYSNEYSLNIEYYWESMKTLPSDSVQLPNIKIDNWTGTATNGMQRGPLQVKCADGAPCTGVDVSDFNIWTETGDSQVFSCRSAHTDLKRAESLYCLKGRSATRYSITACSVTTAPTNYKVRKMADDMQKDFRFTVSIPAPAAMPTNSFRAGRR
jgi:rhamnogalacturonan hydrolase